MSNPKPDPGLGHGKGGAHLHKHERKVLTKWEHNLIATTRASQRAMWDYLFSQNAWKPTK